MLRRGKMLTDPSTATALQVIETPWQKQWQPELIGTLVFLVDNERVLLIEKLTGHGQGKINGPGGKWEAGESLLECARRDRHGSEAGRTHHEPRAPRAPHPAHRK